jgi:spore coat polysaccharide biosynthesis protein SpsF
MTPPADVAIIVQARMGSSRLPGKVLRRVRGRPLLDYLLDRLERVETPHATIVATTTRTEDDPIVALCGERDTTVHRGSADDVLDRYRGAAARVDAGIVARVTGDCPLIDPAIVDRVLARALERQCDYVSNTLERTFPRGLDVEAFPRRVLDEAAAEATEPFEREHVTPFIYRHPERYRLCNVANDFLEGDERWTVDTADDFELVSRIIEALAPTEPAFGLADIRALLVRHPDWRLLNAHVEQKPLGA